ncbi:MAG: bacillithiol system redox-active protein YtxJ [Saprospiraceae bacterium]|nr:bacillithiol system redox-active protein YtxJ [Saprospiraceae bacterium]MCB0577042.1 bacillithiol system redox-active protein YtxJ [Saprospiraceae bacterium]MCB9306762.1 bacillithiol system redox-active protein YtxJ [Lewinellaceae bacterium]MCB9356893.1 bacillithiol system redox-active protein YtxJ [Lewinellaceae bacterium]
MKLNWLPLTTEAEVDLIKERSQKIPCLIFKHSTRCNISSVAKYRLDEDWPFGEDEVEAHFLDLIKYRSVSNHIADQFQVYHESPQVLLIIRGECVYDASHLSISADELKEAMDLETSK